MPQWEGDIATNGERDSYDVRLIAGRTYSIELEGYYTGDPRYDLRDPEVYLYRGGALIDDDDDSGQGYNSRIIFTPTVTTTYRIVAGEHGDNATGSYRLTVSEDDFRDLDTYNNVGTLGSFSTLSYSGSEAEGRIGYQGDNDLFAIDLIGGLSYNFGVSGTGSSGLADPRLQIYTDVKVTEALNSGGDPEDVDFTFEPAATGTYYLRVGEELDSATGRYKLFADLGRAGDGDDTITGTAGANGVFAGGGNDTVSLGAGNDRAYGANGNDTLLGEAGEDWLVGGPGRDRLRGGDDADVLAGDGGRHPDRRPGRGYLPVPQRPGFPLGRIRHDPRRRRCHRLPGGGGRRRRSDRPLADRRQGGCPRQPGLRAGGRSGPGPRLDQGCGIGHDHPRQHRHRQRRRDRDRDRGRLGPRFGLYRRGLHPLRGRGASPAGACGSALRSRTLTRALTWARAPVRARGAAAVSSPCPPPSPGRRCLP